MSLKQAGLLRLILMMKKKNENVLAIGVYNLLERGKASQFKPICVRKGNYWYLSVLIYVHTDANTLKFSSLLLLR